MQKELEISENRRSHPKLLTIYTHIRRNMVTPLSMTACDGSAFLYRPIG